MIILKHFPFVILASVFIILTHVSCDEEGDYYKYSDYSIDGIPSVWRFETEEWVGLSLNTVANYFVNPSESCRSDYYYVSFGDDGKGCLCRYHGEMVDSIEKIVYFDYTTDDNAHFDIYYNGKLSQWTCINKTADFYDEVLFYTDSIINERKIYYYHIGEEVRHDSILYMLAPKLRGLISVPKDRESSTTNIVGLFYGSVRTLDESEGYGLQYYFGENGDFRREKRTYSSSHTSDGKYKIIQDGVDVLELSYEDGTKERFVFVCVDDTLLLYDQDGKRIQLQR